MRSALGQKQTLHERLKTSKIGHLTDLGKGGKMVSKFQLYLRPASRI